MPSLGLQSIGPDVQLTVVGGTGGAITFDRITSWDAAQESTNIKSKGLDGTTRYDELPDGWKGTFDLQRASGVLDDYFAAAEARYFAGGGTYSATITETIQEPSGAISQYRFEGVSLKLDQAGTWKGDALVDQKVSWNASRRRKVI